jgi:hypothetical protein
VVSKLHLKVYNHEFSAPCHPGFLVHFESELLKRAHKNFDFRNGRSADAMNFFMLVIYPGIA